MLYSVYFKGAPQRNLLDINEEALVVGVFIFKDNIDDEYEQMGRKRYTPMNTYDRFGEGMWSSMASNEFLGYTLNNIVLGTDYDLYNYLVDDDYVLYGGGRVYSHIYNKIVPFLRERALRELI